MRCPAWCERYTRCGFEPGGRGPERFDCWGLVRHVLGAHFDVDVPDLQTETAAQPAANADRLALIEDQARNWQEIDPAFARPGDVLVLAPGGVPDHVAVVVAPDVMLHARQGAGVSLEKWTHPKWRGRVVSAHRWAA